MFLGIVVDICFKSKNKVTPISQKHEDIELENLNDYGADSDEEEQGLLSNMQKSYI